jgi:DNA-binding MarR family transcriptional regulator
MTSRAVERVMRAYPQVFFACHVRHLPDPRTRRMLTARQREVLEHLSDVRGMNLRQLAWHTGVTASTMSITIDRLVQRGFVVRAVDAADRRRVELRLTAAGVRIRGAQEVLDAGRVATMLAGLAPHTREAAVRGLEQLAGAAARMMADGVRASKEREDPAGASPQGRRRR